MKTKTLILLRLVMASIFLWAFFDKLFGLGFATAPEKSWINGGSPTYGFLMNATKGPFVTFFHSLASMPLTNWLFMGGLLFIGTTLLLNRFVKWGALAGIVMMLSMYIATVPPVNHPVIDEHIVYALVLALLVFSTKKKA